MQGWRPTFNSDFHFRKTECGPAPLGNMRAKKLSYKSTLQKRKGTAIMHQRIQK